MIIGLHIDSMKDGDYIYIEVLLNEWLPIWKAYRKTNYTNIKMTNVEIFYNAMTHYDLQEMCVNRLMRHTKDGIVMVINKCCEILNDYLKKYDCLQIKSHWLTSRYLYH